MISIYLYPYYYFANNGNAKLFPQLNSTLHRLHQEVRATDEVEDSDIAAVVVALTVAAAVNIILFIL